MPQFKSREEYEMWKAQKMGGSEEKLQLEIPSEKSAIPKKPNVEESSSPPRQSYPPTRQPPLVDGELRSIGELFRDTWDIFKSRFVTLICLYLFSPILMAVVIGVFTGIGFSLRYVLPFGPKGAIVGGALIGMIPGFIVFFWGIAAFTHATTDDAIGVGEAVGRGWRSVGPFIWLSLVSGFIVTGGFFLFIIPGIIFLVWFMFSHLVLTAENERGMNAILKSKKYVKGRWFAVCLRLFIIWLVLVGLGMIPVLGPILSILFAPFALLYLRIVYDDLKESKEGRRWNEPTIGEKLKWAGTGALGYVALPVVLFFFMGASLTVPLLLLRGMMSSQAGQVTITPQKGGASPFGVKPKCQQQTEYQPSSARTQPSFQPDSGNLAMKDVKKSEANGEATVIRNGIKETFALRTGFFSDTRFADPTKATIQFQIDDAKEFSNARRIEISLDATKTGAHVADGKRMEEAFFAKFKDNEDGDSQPSDQNLQTTFQFIADGGQIFFPKGACTIRITSPYTGTPEGVFSGEIDSCVVHSAGIDHTISAKFKMVGVPSR